MKPNLGYLFKDILGPVFGRAVKPSRPQLIVPQLPAPVGLHDFLSMEVPPRGMLLDPILPERSLSMMYAPRGIGKSWIALSIGLAVAGRGSFLRWAAPRSRRVLLCDGEMLLYDLQGRLDIFVYQNVPIVFVRPIRNEGQYCMGGENDLAFLIGFLEMTGNGTRNRFS